MLSLEMKNKLIYFLGRYGNDFFHKLPKYKTALWQGEIVGLSKFNKFDLTFIILLQTGERKLVDLFELDDFVL